MYGIHTSSRRIDGPLAGIFKPLTLAVLLSLTACAGGDIVFEGGSQASKTLDENSSGVIWTARVQVKGALDSKDLVFSLSGEDAALFTLNPTTGALSFKTSPDFEAPLDADKNNDYRLVITAAVKDKTAQQQVSLKINNVTKPVVELIKPKPYENVGAGEPVEVETLVKFYDAESNAPVDAASISLNSIAMEPTQKDPTIWMSKTSVPEGGIDLNIAASAPAVTAINLKEKLLNKRDAANVSYVWAVQGDKMMVAGKGLDFSTSFNLSTHEMVEQNSGLFYGSESSDDLSVTKCSFSTDLCFMPREPVVWLGSLNSSIYVYGPISVDYSLQAQPLFSFRNGPTSDFFLSAVDDTHRNLVYLYGTSGAFDSIAAIPLDVDAFLPREEGTVLLNLPAEAFKGQVKEFFVHGRTNTFIFSENDSVNGVSTAVIRGFNEKGIERFAVQFMSGISNLVVDEEAGLIYLAENSSTSRATLKSIDITTGEVRDLLEKTSEITHGAFTGLTLDQKNNRLFIGDSVSDSIYLVDLASKTMRELTYKHIVIPPPPRVIEGTED
ncbi:MAG: cadherin repeat domain-containing protein [Marinagarivorans sp.]